MNMNKKSSRNNLNISEAKKKSNNKNELNELELLTKISVRERKVKALEDYLNTSQVSRRSKASNSKKVSGGKPKLSDRSND